MSAKKLFAAVRYRKSSMQREILGISHSIASLRRQHEGAHIFQVKLTPIPGSQHDLKDIKFVGKAIKEAPAPITDVVLHWSVAGPPKPQKPFHYRRKRAA